MCTEQGTSQGYTNHRCIRDWARLLFFVHLRIDGAVATFCLVLLDSIAVQ